MRRVLSRVTLLILLGALAAALPIGSANARLVQAQSSERLTNPGFEEPFNGGVANGWRTWYLTPDGVNYPTSCRETDPPTCKPYGIPVYQPAQPQDTRVPPRSISGNSQKWGASYLTYIAGVYQQVGGFTPGTRLQFSAYTQAFNCSNDLGCFGPSGQFGYSYEPGENNLRVGIDPAGGTDPFSSNIIWSSVANPLDAFTLQTVEAVAQSDKVTVFVWSAPQYSQKHIETFVDNASLVATGQGPAPTTAPTTAATQPAGTPNPTVTIPPNATSYTVATGDTLFAIAQRFNLTLDQLLALNPGLTAQSVIQVGQVINVSGTPSATGAPTQGASTAVPTATPPASPTAAPTATATPPPPATESSSPTPEATTLATPTPAQIALASGLCVQAFDDVNTNLIRDEGEALVPGVAFNITSADGATSVDYTTDGQQEPHCFTTLPDGRYAVSTTLPANFSATTDSAWDLALLTGTNVNIVMGTRAEPTPTPPASATQPPAPAPTTAPATTSAASGSGNNASSLALLGGGALILLAGVALFFGLRSRRRSA